MKRLLAISLTVSLLAVAAAGEEVELVRKGGEWVPMAPPKEGSPAGEAALIRRHLDRGEHRSAYKAAKRFLNRYKTDPLREDVLGLAGDAQLKHGKHWSAYGWYQKQLMEFPAGEGMERALTRQMEVAEVFLAGKRQHTMGIFFVKAKGDALEMLYAVAGHAPGTLLAELALLRIADHHFDDRDWADAVDVYNRYLELFTQSSRRPYALLRSAEAMRNEYRGPDWEETSLVEAEQRYKAVAGTYPAEAAKAGVDKILEEIHLTRAAKQQAIADYYRRQDKPRAAAVYYRILVNEYGDTPWGQKARESLAELARAESSQPPGMAASVSTGTDGKETRQ